MTESNSPEFLQTKRVFELIYAHNTPELKRLFQQCPELKLQRLGLGTTWLHIAVQTGSVELVDALLSVGFDINASDPPADLTPLSEAIRIKHVQLARHLLERGANPNIGRNLISAMNQDDETLIMPFVKLLVEHGIDVNQRFELYKTGTYFTALDWAKCRPEIAQYLKAHGARTAEELETEQTQKATKTKKATQKLSKKKPSISAEIVNYFTDNVGSVRKETLIEILPTGLPIAIRAVAPSGDRQHLTLFTVGMSSQPMTTPAGEEEYALAELYIELPGDWKFAQRKEAKYHWPMHWMRKIARHPHENRTWLGGPVTIIANEDPPQPLAPGVNFTCWLLFADKSFETKNGRTIQLYRMIPIYTDERELELREGLPALMRAFDRKSVPWVVDLKRKSVVD